MSAGYVLAMVVAVLVTGAARVLTGARSIARDARRARGGDMSLLAVGLAGLAFHCGAMFYRPAFRSVPGFRPAVDAINALGAASIIAFAVPATVVVIAVRSAHAVAVVLVLAALAGVGMTIYDSGPLSAHLTAIFVAVELILLTAAFSLPIRAPEPQGETAREQD